MNRRNRSIEIFSMSALDLFASAMGAFVLLAVMMLPYYHKGKDIEARIAELEPQVAASGSRAAKAEAEASQAQEALEAIESASAVDLSVGEQAVREAEARGRALEVQIQDMARKIEEKRAAVRAAATPAEKSQTTKVTFRFLGLKTDAKRYLILVDGAARIKERAPNLPAILKSIVEVMGPQKEFAIAFYSYANGGLVYDRWPNSDFATGGTGAQERALDFLRGAYGQMSGGSATFQALLRALDEQPEAIILISDGVVFPRHNESFNWQQVVNEVARANLRRVEVNVVAIGVFSRNASFWTFLNELRKRNGGDLKAIPP